MGVNIMSLIFAHDLLKDMPLAPATKLLKSLSGHYPKFGNFLCPFYLGKWNQSALEFLYL
jgi:hypothetical protein